MTEQEAKTILCSYGPPANVQTHIEAIEVAVSVLGEDATMEQIWKWAKEKKNEADEGTV